MSLKAKIIKTIPTAETLRINRSKGSAVCQCRIFTYTDKDTNQIVTIIPALDISGYGDTESKAREMLDSSIDFFFNSLFGLTSAKMERELIKMGWRRKNLHHKEFSKAYIDGAGQLKDFNAVEDKVQVEMETITL